MQQSGDIGLTNASFKIPAAAEADLVWVRTKDASGDNRADSIKVPVGGVTGATSVTVTTICQ